MRWALAWACVATFCVGCAPGAGQCDEALAGRIVYLRGRSKSSADYGIPMYEGQAVVTASCGDTAFCHGSAAKGADRYGVPATFNFDMPVGCLAGPCVGDEIYFGRQTSDARRVHDYEARIRKFIDNHRMPPGAVGASVDAKASTFVYVTAASGFDLESSTAPVTPLVTTDRSAAYEIVRNWFACGMPLVEATRVPVPGTSPGDSCDSASGGTFPTCVQRVSVPPDVPDPTFDSIYGRILSPVCGTTCHAQSSPNDLARSHLDMSSAATAYAALVGVPAAGVSCGQSGLVRVVPGDPDGSLLVQKLVGSATCGDPMPARNPYGLLPTPVIDAIRTWITNGATGP